MSGYCHDMLSVCRLSVSVTLMHCDKTTLQVGSHDFHCKAAKGSKVIRVSSKTKFEGSP